MNKKQVKLVKQMVPTIGRRVLGLLYEGGKKKHTQEYLAKKLQISQGSLSDIINGKSLPSATTLTKMAILDIDTSYILKGNA